MAGVDFRTLCFGGPTTCRTSRAKVLELGGRCAEGFQEVEKPAEIRVGGEGLEEPVNVGVLLPEGGVVNGGFFAETGVGVGGEIKEPGKEGGRVVVAQPCGMYGSGVFRGKGGEVAQQVIVVNATVSAQVERDGGFIDAG